MKKILTKLLFISLLFSAIMPTGARANGFWKEVILPLLGACGALSILGTLVVWSTIRTHNKEMAVDNNLKQAIKNNDMAKVKQILEENPAIKNHQNFLTSIYDYYPHETPLTFAAQCSHPEIVKLFLPYGLNRRNSDYLTALMIAAKCGPTEVVKLLLEHGANVNEQNNWKPLLLIAVKSDHTEIAKLLLEYGADANVRDKNGRTVLMIAAQRSQYAKQIGNIALKNEFDNLIKLLFVFGANPLIKDNNGRTVLDQTDNEIIRKFMHQQILPILNDEKVTPIVENFA